MSVSTMTDEEIAQLRSVKGNLQRANGLVRYLNGEMKKRDEWSLERFSDDDKWLYVEEFQIASPYNGKSEIRPYTNKRGFTSMAHYNRFGKYMGSVKQKGEKPIDCTYYEVPSKKTWEIVRGRFVKKL